MANLGYLYERGIGVEKDFERAKRMYEKAADLGDSYGFYFA